jgi:hypothetical protein
MLREVVVRDSNVGSENSRWRVWGQKPGQLAMYANENIKVMCAWVNEVLAVEIPISSNHQHQPKRKEGFLHV